MNRVFSIGQAFRVPDKTLLSPFLNGKDCMSGLPFDLLDFSIGTAQLSAKILRAFTSFPTACKLCLCFTERCR